MGRDPCVATAHVFGRAEAVQRRRAESRGGFLFHGCRGAVLVAFHFCERPLLATALGEEGHVELWGRPLTILTREWYQPFHHSLMPLFQRVIGRAAWCAASCVPFSACNCGFEKATLL